MIFDFFDLNNIRDFVFFDVFVNENRHFEFVIYKFFSCQFSKMRYNIYGRAISSNMFCKTLYIKEVTINSNKGNKLNECYAIQLFASMRHEQYMT